jgi:protein tyrosine phosphatase (PTP) superfamily phosphohydrolase (DUF442 family)
VSSNQNPFRIGAGVVLTILMFAAVASAQTSPSSAVAQVHIKNFGQMDDRFFRGAQPKEKDFADLATLGIQTVIDLRDNPEAYEKPTVEGLHMRYINIPMSDKDYPKEEQIAAFLKLVDDPATGKFYVHCAGGRHRTGVMGAVYRFDHYHWTFDQVYGEMKNYDFYTRWGHGDMKKYVEDYWQRIQTASISPSKPYASVGVK